MNDGDAPFGVTGHGLWYINRSGTAAWHVDDPVGTMPSGIEGEVFYALLKAWVRRYEARNAARQTGGTGEA